MSMSFRLLTLGLCTFALIGFTGVATGQQYPDKAITYIMPMAAGSGIEAHARIVAAEAGKVLGQSMVVENRVGAGGKIAISALVKSRNDGYTVGLTYSGPAVTTAIFDSSFQLRPGKDYQPVTLTSTAPLVIVAHPGAPFKDMKGLVAYAKANPGKLTVAGSSRGSNAHLGWELIKHIAGIDVTLVIYNGDPQATIDLLNGQYAALMASTTTKPYVEAGKLIGIATTGPTPWAVFPTLPTVSDTIKGVELVGWYGIIAPPGTPAPVVARLNEAFKTALARPEVRKKLLDHGVEAHFNPGGIRDLH
jgi:tripartite-type tricarboxylate transporter receptor subunit TctC